LQLNRAIIARAQNQGKKVLRANCRRHCELSHRNRFARQPQGASVPSVRYGVIYTLFARMFSGYLEGHAPSWPCALR